ncbi:GGDEF domain-containing protein [Pseudoalteromonas tunicata]|uniref:GGDEF domain-containing protein n=1 Tax=Pseudoalteromonas tunicata TaxID=314281 RepID=UPI00273FE933|nr:GGDEF domain-containing protein [Pseudoalteromonas tunicata]MDP4984765.1 diguanylate cyclase [Pseudoalteromonas tunicata]
MSNNKEIESLEKKLASTIQSRNVIEQARHAQIATLVQFVSKLSLTCKGIDIELDNRLANFRSLISKGIDFERLKPLIDDISILLQQQESRQDANIRELHQTVNDAGKRLQQSKGVPDDLRRSLRNLLTNELNDIKATQDFVPVLSNLVEIYHQVLNNKHGDLSSEPEQLSPDLANELLNLTSELAFEGESAKKIDYIKQRISTNHQLNVLLDSCINIIRLIVATISQERQTAQSFLFAINETLSLLHQTLLDSVNRSKDVGHRMAQLNQKIEDKIYQLNDQSQQANSITELKLIVGKKLEALTLDIKYKEELEIQERECITESLKVMQTRIDSLEKETSIYRERLAEQKFKSLQDSLTKLPNRAAFDERFQLEFNSFKRNNKNLCLVVIDVDHFKRINDSFGHSAGDKTLQVIASALKKTVRNTDFIARFGGEEFIIIMPDTDLKQIIQPLEKIRKAIKAIPFKFKDTSVQITISIGATQFMSVDTTQEVFDRADDALYEAKRTGRDRLVIKK